MIFFKSFDARDYIENVLENNLLGKSVYGVIQESFPTTYVCLSNNLSIPDNLDPRYAFTKERILLDETHSLISEVVNNRPNLLLLVNDEQSSYNWKEETKVARAGTFSYVLIDNRQTYIITPPAKKETLDKAALAGSSIYCDLIYLVDFHEAGVEFSDPPRGLEYTEHVEDIARGVIAVFIGAFDGSGYLLLPVQHDRFETLFSDHLKQSSFSGRKSWFFDGIVKSNAINE